MTASSYSITSLYRTILKELRQKFPKEQFPQYLHCLNHHFRAWQQPNSNTSASSPRYQYAAENLALYLKAQSTFLHRQSFNRSSIDSIQHLEKTANMVGLTMPTQSSPSALPSTSDIKDA